MRKFQPGDKIVPIRYPAKNIRVVVGITDVYIVKHLDIQKYYQDEYPMGFEYVESNFRKLTKLELALK